MKSVRISSIDAGKDASNIFQKAVDDLPNGGEIVLETGIYVLSAVVEINGKRDIVFDGQGSTLSPYFNLEEGVDTGSEVFHIQNCKNVTLKNFKVSSPVPVNTAGAVINVTEKYVDVKLKGKYPLTGNEQFISGMTFDETWAPSAHYWLSYYCDESQRTVIAGEIACSAPKKLNTPHEMIDDQTVRVYTKDPDGIEAGMNCNILHSYYGICAFVFRQCEGVTVEDVHMANYGGFGFALLPCCRDFTFRRVKFMTDSRENQPYAINSDGIHMKGLSGKLLIEDCDFDCIGDDSLNIHTQVMTVKEAEGERLTLFYNKKMGVISRYWSQKGDLLRIYDPDTLELRGKVRVASADKGDIRLEAHGVEIRSGDYVTNDKYYPEVVIRNCRYDRYRARGMCVQGVKSMLIEDCQFNGASTCSIYLSTAFDYWMEAGPLENVTVRNNIFRTDRPWSPRVGAAAIFVRVNGKRHQNIKPIHKNVTLENNRFENIQGPLAVIHLTDGVTVRNNIFVGCGEAGQNIITENCENVICEGNRAEE